MAASTSIQLYTGGTGGAPDTTLELSGGNIELRHKQEDDSAADLNNPVPIPSAGGENYSWRKHTKLVFTSNPAESISNLRWYAQSKSGLTNWSGVTLYVGLTADANYVKGSTSDETTKMAQASLDAAENYSTGSPLVVNSGALGITTTTTVPTDGTQDYVVQQMGVGDSATSGVTWARNVYYRYDEI